MSKKILRFIYHVINTILGMFKLKLIRFRDVSFSQKREDIFVEEILDLLNIMEPNYLDVGANDPVAISNTYKFYLKGSSGVCVEPNPVLCAKFSKYRPKDLVLNIGATADHEGTLQFYKLSSDVLSTFIKEEAERIVSSYPPCSIIEIIEIPTLPLRTIIKKYLNNKVDFLSIDTEDLDLDLLKSLDFNTCRPAVICIETRDYMEPVWDSHVDKIEEYMRKNQYNLYADTALNRIYFDLERVNKINNK